MRTHTLLQNCINSGCGKGASTEILSTPYSRGLFASINNHKQTSADLYPTLKKQYQSMMRVCTGKNIGKSSIKIVDKLPSQEQLKKALEKKNLVMAAAIHHYDQHDKRTNRGSTWNYEQYEHLHFYVFGVHWHFPYHKNGVEGAVEHLKHLLYRHNRFGNKIDNNNIDIRQVGKGKNMQNDDVTAESLREYLDLPNSNPSKDCVINYMAGTRENNQHKNTIFYIYANDRT